MYNRLYSYTGIHCLGHCVLMQFLQQVKLYLWHVLSAQCLLQACLYYAHGLHHNNTVTFTPHEARVKYSVLVHQQT